MIGNDPIKAAIANLPGLPERERDLLAWLATVKQGGRVTATRAEIGKATGIEPSYVHTLLTRLIRKGFVKITRRVETHYVGRAYEYEVIFSALQAQFEQSAS